jgi:hypothetical protein
MTARTHPISGLPEIGFVKCANRLKPTCGGLHLALAPLGDGPKVGEYGEQM